jgi:hypothetical protein
MISTPRETRDKGAWVRRKIALAMRSLTGHGKPKEFSQSERSYPCSHMHSCFARTFEVCVRLVHLCVFQRRQAVLSLCSCTCSQLVELGICGWVRRLQRVRQSSSLLCDSLNINILFQHPIGRVVYLIGLWTSFWAKSANCKTSETRPTNTRASMLAQS